MIKYRTILNSLLIILLILTNAVTSVEASNFEYSNVIIFIPAFQATELFEDEGKEKIVWADATKRDFAAFIRTLKHAWGSMKYPKSLHPGEPFGWEGTITSNHNWTNAYGEFQKHFEKKGYKVIPFPYDWRMNNEDHIELLRSKILETLDKENVNSVNIVAHSMGGLIAKRYILEYPDNSMVSSFISVGTPYYGTPESF